MDKIRKALAQGDMTLLAERCGCTTNTVRTALREPHTALHYDIIASAKQLIQQRREMLR